MSRGFSRRGRRNNLPRPLEKAQQDSAPRRTAEMWWVIARAQLHNNFSPPRLFFLRRLLESEIDCAPTGWAADWLFTAHLWSVCGGWNINQQQVVILLCFLEVLSRHKSDGFFGFFFFQNEIRKRTWEEVSCQKDSVISTWNKKNKIKCDEWRNAVSALWSN